VYESEFLKLVVFDEEQIKEVHQWFNDYAIQANTSQTGTIARPWTLEEFKEDVKDQRHRYAVRIKASGELIGYATLFGTSLTQAIHPMTYLKPEARGKGYGTELSALLCDIAFLECNAHKFSTTVYGYNEASYHRYEKLGFKLEARLRDEVYRMGRYWDVLTYGLLREEWERWEKHAIVLPETYAKRMGHEKGFDLFNES
jgi:RimJ/RimL family protein N-acetyltransferase